MRKLLLGLAPLALIMSACQPGVTMWDSCTPAADGNPSGTDGTYVLACKDGEWVPWMTVDEWVRLNRGEQVTFSPLPTRPTTTTTTTTTAPTTTTTTTMPTPAPGISALSPTSGPTTGGTAVTVTGTDFTGATAVNFGGVPAPSFTVDSDTQITATSPAGTDGVVDLTVTTSAGTSPTSSADEFTYVVPPPVITGRTPNAVMAIFGPWQVVITGSGFTGTTSVDFGPDSATTFTVDSDTQITASTRATVYHYGPSTLTVTAPSGTATFDWYWMP